MATDTLAHNAHAHEHGHHDTGPMKVFGFWIYLMSDCIISVSYTHLDVYKRQ